MATKCNHCAVLIYAGKGLKDKSYLGYHTDCVYSASDGNCVEQSNSQVDKTPAVIYSLGDSKTLNWKIRYTLQSLKGSNIWIDNKDDI